MGQISSELTSFKNTVEPEIGKMTSSCNSLQEKVQSVSSSTSAAKSGFDGGYSSTNKSTVLTKFDYISDIFSKVSTSLGGDLQGMISEASNVISLVHELEDINSEIERQQAIVNSANNSKSDDKNAASRKSNAQSIINQKNSEFTEKHEEALQKLAALKSKDGDLSFANEFAASGELDTADLKYGTFEKKTFVASNGIAIDYFIYVPDYGKDVEGLPVLEYMHGIGFEDTGDQIVTYGGLGEAIKNKTVTPSGIVVMPHVKNGRLYESKDYRDALAELPVAVSQEYNGDPNKISVGGVSYGGVTAVKMVNEHPDTFSSVVSACGSNDVTTAFNGVKTWFFNGRNEANNHTGRKYVGQQAEAIKQVGGTAMYTLFEDVWGHTNVGTKAFQNKYQDETGEEIYPFEWAFKQEKA